MLIFAPGPCWGRFYIASLEITRQGMLSDAGFHVGCPWTNLGHRGGSRISWFHPTDSPTKIPTDSIPIRWLSYVKNHLNSPDFRHDAEDIQFKELKQFSTIPSGYKSQFTIRWILKLCLGIPANHDSSENDLRSSFRSQIRRRQADKPTSYMTSFRVISGTRYLNERYLCIVPANISAERKLDTKIGLLQFRPYWPQ